MTGSSYVVWSVEVTHFLGLGLQSDFEEMLLLSGYPTGGVPQTAVTWIAVARCHKENNGVGGDNCCNFGHLEIAVPVRFICEISSSGNMSLKLRKDFKISFINFKIL